MEYRKADGVDTIHHEPENSNKKSIDTLDRVVRTSKKRPLRSNSKSLIKSKSKSKSHSKSKIAKEDLESHHIKSKLMQQGFI